MMHGALADLAPAKINLALVVGPVRSDGNHEVATLMERLTLADRLTLEPAHETSVIGFSEDTIVAKALALLAEAAGHDGGWTVRLEKEIPVAAGLGGGSSDAACALRLANEQLARPLTDIHLLRLASRVGADVPFFLTAGPQLATGDGSQVTAMRLPRDYTVVLLLPAGEVKQSTAAVYERFDGRGGEAGFETRRAELLASLAGLREPADLGSLPPNDLASSPLAGLLIEAGAFRADVSGAGPTVYGLFEDAYEAARAAGEARRHGRVWVARPG